MRQLESSMRPFVIAVKTVLILNKYETEKKTKRGLWPLIFGLGPECPNL